MKIIDGGVTAAKGFKAAGMHAGIKKGTKKRYGNDRKQCTMYGSRNVYDKPCKKPHR